MKRTPLIGLVIALAPLALGACGDSERSRPAETYGAHPTLPTPVHSWIPTINVAAATGWSAGRLPTPAPGLSVSAFASGLEHPRWLAVMPNGDVLVAETSAPKHDRGGFSLRGLAVAWFMRKAGASPPSPDRITLLRRDGTGKVTRSTYIAGLHSPFGMVLSGDTLYVADTDALLAFPYRPDASSITTPPRRVTDLPAGPNNHHWTKDVIASPDGKTLYVTVGSNSNRAENGMRAEENRACVLMIDATTGASRVFATGLRNPNGLAFEPKTGALWVAVNERDEMGDDLVPDYMTSVREFGFYGWPYTYWGAHPDPRLKAQRPDLVAEALTKAIVPDYALGAHTASLGLTFSQGASLPPAFSEGAFVGQHGSWNRRPVSGYKVLFVPFKNGTPSGPPRDVLTGFVGPGNEAFGRPVGVRIAKDGTLLVADDVGGIVWRVATAPSTPSR